MTEDAHRLVTLVSLAEAQRLLQENSLLER